MTMSATSSSESSFPSDFDAAGTSGAGDAAAPAVRRRAVRRPSKPDAVLAAAVETARAGLLEVVPAEQIGAYAGATPDAERLVTHRFEALRPGYSGWHWYATLARVSRGKTATVCEVGLLPSEKAVLAPEWVPWSERVRPEDVAAEEAAHAEEAERARLRADAEGVTPDAEGGNRDDADSSAWADGALTPEDD